MLSNARDRQSRRARRQELHSITPAIQRDSRIGQRDVATCARSWETCMRIDARPDRSACPMGVSGLQVWVEVEFVLCAAMWLKRCLRSSAAMVSECSATDHRTLGHLVARLHTRITRVSTARHLLHHGNVAKRVQACGKWPGGGPVGPSM